MRKVLGAAPQLGRQCVHEREFLVSIELDPDLDGEIRRAQAEARVAVAHAKLIVERSRTFLERGPKEDGSHLPIAPEPIVKPAW
jgi:hypothetical protein